MKFLALLLFVNSVCLAQSNIVVKNQAGELLSGVSIFETSATNSLISISDSFGNNLIYLQANKNYLFHLLGYEDRTISGIQLSKESSVILQNSIYQLNEVVVKKTKLKKELIKNKPGNFSLAEANSINATFERVVPIIIEKPGFLSKFNLFARQNFDGNVRVFRFILLNAEQEKPGKSIIGNTVIGIFKSGKMIFNLDSLGIYLEKGKYFIGYETQNNGKLAEDGRKYKSTDGSVRIEYPMIFIKGKIVNTPKTFTRNNLEIWQSFKVSFHKDEQKFIDIAYELEMLIPTN